MTKTYDNAVLSHNEVMAEQVCRLRDALETVQDSEWIVTSGDCAYFVGTQYRTQVLMSFNVLEAKKLGFGDAVRWAARLEDGKGNPLKEVRLKDAILAEIEKTEECIRYFEEAIKGAK